MASKGNMDIVAEVNERRWASSKSPSKAKAFISFIRLFLRRLSLFAYRTAVDFRTEWNKAKMPTMARLPLPDPVTNLLEKMGEKVVEDEAKPVAMVYKTLSGSKYFTDAHFERTLTCPDCEGKGCVKCDQIGKLPLVNTPEPQTIAYEISDERADELIAELEDISMHMNLDEEHQTLLKMLRKNRADRFAL